MAQMVTCRADERYHKPKTRSVWPTLLVKMPAPKSGREQAFSSQLGFTSWLLLRPIYKRFAVDVVDSADC